MNEKTPPVERANALYYIGETDPVSGAPIQSLLGVPSTDLDAAAVAALSDADYAAALATGIFSTSKPKAAKTAPAEPSEGGA